jgi:DNA-directed RNA polymerase specialized sigma24 family protein
VRTVSSSGGTEAGGAAPVEGISEVARPRVIGSKVVVRRVTRKTLWLSWLNYAFLIYRGRKGYRVEVYRYDPDMDSVVDLAEGSFREGSELGEILGSIEDGVIGGVKDTLASEILNYVSSWRRLLIEENIRKLLKERIAPIRGGWVRGGWDNTVGTITSIENLRFEELYDIIRRVYLEKVAELLEVVISCAITLKYVDRSRGIYKNRPNWLVLLSDPSTYKTTALEMLRYSKSVFIANKFTAASFLSANTDVTPLIDFIHNKLFIVPTFTEEASDVDTAKKIFATLESIYDGFYGKATGMSGFMAREVDTVVLAAITPAVWTQVFPYIQNIGSRWLVYRYELSDEEGIEIQKSINSNRGVVNQLQITVSKFFDFLIDNVTLDDLEEVKPTETQDKELQLMAMLMARLRAAFRTYKLEAKSEDEGSKVIIDVEVVQREAPGRAYQQLLNFVRANSLLRKSELKRVVGVPVVLDRSMRLAFELAISSSDPRLASVFTYVARNSDTPLSIREIARATGLGKTTVERLLQVLQHPKVDLIYEDNGYYRVSEPFAGLIDKYLGGS